MNVEVLKNTNKVVPFQNPRLTESTIILQIGNCKVHGIPEQMTDMEFEKLVTTVKYAITNQFKDYWFNIDQKSHQKLIEKSDERNEKEIIDCALNWLNSFLEWRFDEDKYRYFEKNLAKLPTLHQEIIIRKYVQIDEKGKQPLDDFVYSELYIGRTYYYKKKKEALYLLGKVLYI